jgi:probable HAF family extracellular repeat protein
MRRAMLSVCAAVLAAVAAVLVAGASASVQARWVITDLGTLGGKESVAYGINERGQIVGGSQTGTGASHAFLWESGKMRDLGTLGGETSQATAINEHGQIVGYALTADGAPHAFLWNGGKPRDLGALPGYTHSVAVTISERGQVAGFSMNRYLKGEPADRRAFLWEGGEMRDLGKLPAFAYTSLVAVNDRGQVAGTGFDTLDLEPDLLGQTGLTLDGQAFVWANGRLRPLATPGVDARSEAVGINMRGQVIGVTGWIGHRPTRSVLWQGGRVRDLGTLGGKQSRPFDINEGGQIVGWSTTGTTAKGGSSLVWHAFLWQSGKMRDLGTLGGEFSVAVSTNDHAQIVGLASTGSIAPDRGPVIHASVWQDGKMTDLGTLRGGLRSVAMLITERGQVIGWSNTKTGQKHAVLWTHRSG